MKLQIRGRNVEVSKVLRAHVERRLGFALGRFGEQVGPVIVRFSHAKGHRGGVDQRCQLYVALRPRIVRVDETDTDLFAAVDHAADRASRSVARAFDRERGWDQTPTRPWSSAVPMNR